MKVPSLSTHPRSDKMSREFSWSTKHFWSSRVKQFCSIPLNSWRRWGQHRKWLKKKKKKKMKWHHTTNAAKSNSQDPKLIWKDIKAGISTVAALLKELACTLPEVGAQARLHIKGVNDILLNFCWMSCIDLRFFWLFPLDRTFLRDDRMFPVCLFVKGTELTGICRHSERTLDTQPFFLEGISFSVNQRSWCDNCFH